jgi:hypothetical protein
VSESKQLAIKAVRSATCGHLRNEANHNQDPRAEWTDKHIAIINAAPDLLAACKAMAAIDIYGKAMPRGFMAALDKIEAAIAKAEGR